MTARKGGYPLVYAIKFIYSWLLPPGLFIVLLLLLAIRLWKRNRKPSILVIGIALLLYLFSIQPVSQLLLGELETVYAQPELTSVKGDVIVVLGGGATQSTPDLDGQGNLSGSAANRMLTAVRLHRLTGLPILFSGGQVFPDSGNEANIARRQLLELGVADSDILVENRSLNTEQNAVGTAAILKEKGYLHPILVTSAFHMPRSMIEFNKAGLEAQAFPTDYHTNGLNQTFYFSQLSPGAEFLQNSGTALKEYLGIVATKLL